MESYLGPVLLLVLLPFTLWVLVLRNNLLVGAIGGLTLTVGTIYYISRFSWDSIIIGFVIIVPVMWFASRQHDEMVKSYEEQREIMDKLAEE